MKDCDCEPCSTPPARKLRELYEDMERVLALTEDSTRWDSDLLQARRLVRKASETAARLAERVAELEQIERAAWAVCDSQPEGSLKRQIAQIILGES